MHHTANPTSALTALSEQSRNSAQRLTCYLAAQAFISLSGHTWAPRTHSLRASYQTAEVNKPPWVIKIQPASSIPFAYSI